MNDQKSNASLGASIIYNHYHRLFHNVGYTGEIVRFSALKPNKGWKKLGFPGRALTCMRLF